MARARFPFPLLALPLLLLLAAPALATTYVPMSDGELADEATVIAEVRIDAVHAAPWEPPGHLLPGFDSPPAEREPGRRARSSSACLAGSARDGLGLEVSGAPSSGEGDRALLFLTERADGTYAVLDLLLGAFHEVELRGGGSLSGDLRGRRRCLPGGKAAAALRGPAARPRALRRLARRPGQARRGRRTTSSTLPKSGRACARSSPSSRQEERASSALVPTSTHGGSITFLANSSGQAGLAGGGFDGFQSALAAWNAEPHTPIRYLYGGTTTATRGITTNDDVNALLFGDPNEEICGPFDCTSAAPWPSAAPGSTRPDRRPSTARPSGHPGAGIVTNDGIDCYSSPPAESPRQGGRGDLAHELGHTLGLGHLRRTTRQQPNPTRDALMRAVSTADGRGARFGSDDLAGVRRLYAREGRRHLPLPAEPTGRSAWTAGASGWSSPGTNQFDGSTGSAGRSRRPTSPATSPSAIRATSSSWSRSSTSGAAPIKVFYGELTNLIST